MIEFTKKNKKIILSSSIFIGINSNIYCGCKGKKCSGEKTNTTLENNNSTTKTGNPNPSENPDPQKKLDPKENPPKPGETPGENPQQNEFLQKKQSLLQKIEDLKKLCPKCKGMSSGGKTYDQIYSEELREYEDEINKIIEVPNNNRLNNIEFKIETTKEKINKTANQLINSEKLCDFSKDINTIKDDIVRNNLEKEKEDLSTKNWTQDVTEEVKNLEKKINDQLNKEDSGRKNREEKRKNVLDLLKKLENLKLNLTLLSYKLDITENQITEAKTIEDLNGYEGTLKNTEKNINQIIADQNRICKDRNDFIDSFKRRRIEIADSSIFENLSIKKKLKDNEPNDGEINEYYQMYQDMTNDIFNSGMVLNLLVYRYILKLEGFTTALDNIFKKNTQYWFLYLFNKSNANTFSPSVIEISKNNYKIGLELDKKKCLEVESGDFCVENEKFKYLRCKEGCSNGANCVSCKLRKLLTDEGILDDFLNIYKQQGEASDKPEAMLMKRILFTGLKKDKQDIKSYYSTSKESNLDKFKNDVNNKIIKSVMIEWALTIEFMKKFILKYYGSDKFNLYRTFGPGNNNFIDLNIIKHDLYESTCLMAPAFIPDNSTIRNNIEKVKLCSFTKTKNYVKYYRCFFNHIISPNEECILKGDYEHEIGFIGINEKYEKISNKSGDEYINEYNNFLKNATLNNAKKNLPGATISI